VIAPKVADGWLVVDCDAPDMVPVFIAVGTGPPRWQAAFRDWEGGARVAKVRVAATGRQDVQLRVGDVVTKLGRVYL
jgi:hypothetical protein